MKPVKQLYRHDPPRVFGDCHRAALASILELPCEAVPHFYELIDGEKPDPATVSQRERSYLASQGLVGITTCFSEGIELQAVLDGIAYYNPGVYWILGGTSRNGTGHSVVACDGAIVHDPALDESGIVGPMDNGHYWATFIGAGIASKQESV